MVGLQDAIKLKSKLIHPAHMLQVFVVAGPGKRQMKIDSMQDLWDEGATFKFNKLVVNYDMNKDNPILVKLPCKWHPFHPKYAYLLIVLSSSCPSR
jgi:hypothetical protein